MTDSILVLIPAHNEGDRIGAVIDGVLAQLPGAEVLVIDDGSSDNTAQQAQRGGARTIRHAFNLGYGAALQTGYHYALRRGYQRTVQMDGDGQHDPSSLPALLAGLDRGSDVVVGSRYRQDHAPATSWLRLVGSRMFAWIVTHWTGIKITDPTSGYQAMSRRALHEVTRDSFPEDYPDADVLISLHRGGLRLAETPVTMHPRASGVSMHRGSRAAYYAYKMAITLTLLPIRRKSVFREQKRAASASVTP